MFSSRVAKIILICIASDDYITYNQLSKQLQISSRTIMRELNTIHSSLATYALEMIIKKGKGIKIIGNDKDKQRLTSFLKGMQVDYLDKEERKELLSIELLQTNEIQKIMYYGSIFQVSQATISNDLDDLESFFNSYKLLVVRKPGVGVIVIGDETNRRQALSSLINRSIQHHLAHNDFNRYNIEDVTKQLFASKDSNMIKLLDKNILIEILKELKLHHKALGLDYIAQSSYTGLLIHLMIAVQRIKQGKQVKENANIVKLITDEVAIKNAKKIIKFLSKRFNITFNETEYAFIAIHLQSAKTTFVNTNEEVDFEYYPVIKEMLDVFKKADYDLDNDYVLLNGLVAHLKPAMVRLTNGLPIYNPMLKQIKSSYLDIYNVTSLAVNCIKNNYNVEINSDEIGYLALHFGAAIERKKQTPTNLTNINVGIVCSSGIGLSALLMARLKRVVDRHVNIIPLSINQIDTSNFQLLLSTFALNRSDLITINPLLSQNDVTTILRRIEEIRSNALDSIEITQKPSLNLSVICDDIKKLLDAIEVYICDESLNKEQLLIAMVHHFYPNNDTLVDLLMKREKLGSNVYHSFNFALFHTVCDVVTNATIKIVQPRKPFVAEDLEDINVCILMLLPNNSSNSQRAMMSYISASLLEKKDFLIKISDGNVSITKDAFNLILQTYLKEALEGDHNE